MIEVKDLTIELLDGGFLIQNLTFALNKGDKLAIIGEEGTGKSTILKAIAAQQNINTYAKVTGNIFSKDLKIAYCEQILDATWNKYSAIQFLLKPSIYEEERWELYNKIGDIYRICNKIGLKKSIIDEEQIIETLSGGEKVKLQICKVLINGCDVLLLDEPTNDLDIETLVWLEGFILKQTIPIVYISHDVKLLETTANRILHIEYSKERYNVKFSLENLSYIDFVKKRELKMQKQEQIAKMQKRVYTDRKNTLSGIKSSVRSDQIKIHDPSTRRLLNKKMANVLAQEARLQKFKDSMEQRPQYDEYMTLSFLNSNSNPNKKIVLNCNIPRLVAGSTLLSKDVSLKIVGNEKVAILGKNGCGKSTLLKTIYQQIQLDENNSSVKVAYIPQNYNEYFDFKMTPINFLKEKIKNVECKSHLSLDTCLATLKFSRRDMFKPINQLSYGQMVKLILLTLTLNDYNFLILDELTRNLSPLSITVINKLFKDYHGAILAVTHDRKFLEDVIDKIYYLTEEGLREK